MRPKIFIDGEHGTTGLQIRTRLAARDDIEVISVPAERRKDPAARAEFLNAADVAILRKKKEKKRERERRIPQCGRCRDPVPARRRGT